MQGQNVVRQTKPPVLIKTTGLSDEAKRIFDSIARRAYELFESNGRAGGHDMDNWFRAEAEMFTPAPLTITESRDRVIVRADVRDFAPREVEIDLEPRRVTIIGKSRHHGNGEMEGMTASETGKTRLLSSLQLPFGIDLRYAAVRFKKGFVELKLRKTPAANGEAVQGNSNGDAA